MCNGVEVNVYVADQRSFAIGQSLILRNGVELSAVILNAINGLRRRSLPRLPPRPMGVVAPGESCTVIPLDGPLPDGVQGEVRIHREIYRRWPDVGGIVRAMPPMSIALADRLGPGRGFLMRGNCTVTAGSSIEEATVLA